MVNTRRVSLNYNVEEVGKSGVSDIELWYTTDGRKWEPYRKFSHKDKRPLEFEARDEGRYGFTLVVYSGVGLSIRPPQLGEPPQVWVEVDLTKPVVKGLDVQVGRGLDTGKLFVRWDAHDKNLAPQPITLSYAEKPEGLWTKIVESNLENTGSHVWQMPPDNHPYQFYVKVEAADLAGNVGSAQTEKVVKVDLARPRGVILDVQPARPGAKIPDGNPEIRDP
jgi:hypothetical protein